jgi:tRNA threonylcarbamoyl adenosine modification protein YeaZ
MKILALEFSSERRSVAAAVDHAVLAQATESGARESHPFRLAEAVLSEARLEREDIECVAVGLGPGSYHGIRSAIALAEGWQLARPIRLCGVSSVEAIIFEAQRRAFFGRVTVGIDAQRGEFYLATYEVGLESHREIEALRLVERAAVEATPGPDHWLVGPEVRQWWETGETVFPSAAAVARLAAGSVPIAEGHRLEPLYLRPTQFVKAPPPRTIPGV